jgi:hypothetical protein
MIFRSRGNKVSGKLLEKLTLDQRVELRNEMSEELEKNGYDAESFLKDFDEDTSDMIIEKVQDEYLHKIFKACEYKNKNGDVCGELDCQKHVLNAKGVLVCKKSKKEVEKKVESDDEDSS